MKSNLPTAILGQIWNLADLNKDGRLDKKEFSIACYLIKKILTNGQIILPTILPSSLLIEPTVTLINPPNSTGSVPLIPASFPTSSPTFSTNFNTNTTNVSPILFPAASTPALNQFNPTTIAPTTTNTSNRMPTTTSIPLFQNTTTNIPNPKITPSLIPGAVVTPLVNVNNL